MWILANPVSNHQQTLPAEDTMTYGLLQQSEEETMPGNPMETMPLAPFDHSGLVELETRHLHMELASWQNCFLEIRDEQGAGTVFFTDAILDCELRPGISDLTLFGADQLPLASWIVQTPLLDAVDAEKLSESVGETEENEKPPVKEEENAYFQAQAKLTLEGSLEPVVETLSTITAEQEPALQRVEDVSQTAAEPALCEESISYAAQPMAQAALAAETMESVSLPNTQTLSDPMEAVFSTNSEREAAQVQKQMPSLKNANGQVLESGRTVYVSDLRLLDVSDPDGQLEAMTVYSPKSGKTYESLSAAASNEQNTTLQIQAQLTGSTQDKSLCWQVVELSPSLQQQVSFGAKDTSLWFSRSENGQLQSHRQSAQDSILLCREFEPVAQAETARRETLRLYVPDEIADYALQVNGQDQPVQVEKDELGTPYVPVQTSLRGGSVVLKQAGKTVFSQTLSPGYSQALWALLIPTAGALLGFWLDGRRRLMRKGKIAET